MHAEVNLVRFIGETVQCPHLKGDIKDIDHRPGALLKDVDHGLLPAQGSPAAW